MTLDFFKFDQAVVLPYSCCANIVSLLQLINVNSGTRYVAIHLANTFFFSCLNQKRESEVVHIQMGQIAIYMYSFALGLRYGLFGSYRTLP